MPKPGLGKTCKYSEEFKATAVQLSALQDVLIQDAADMARLQRRPRRRAAKPDDDLVQLKLKLHHDPDFLPGMKELSDIRQVDQFEVTQAGIKEFAGIDETYAEELKEHKLAIVVPNTMIQGMAQMYQMMTEMNKPNVKVFRDVEEARKWLKI